MLLSKPMLITDWVSHESTIVGRTWICHINYTDKCFYVVCNLWEFFFEVSSALWHFDIPSKSLYFRFNHWPKLRLKFIKLWCDENLALNVVLLILKHTTQQHTCFNNYFNFNYNAALLFWCVSFVFCCCFIYMSVLLYIKQYNTTNSIERLQSNM